MAEGVVVVLEAVEVEQHEHDRAGVVGVGHELGELAQERAAVAEPGQRVGQRLVARGAQHRDVLAEGQHQPRHDRDQRQRAQPHRDRVHVSQAAVDQHRQADRAEPERHGDEAQPVGHRGPSHHGRLPGGERDQEQAERPADVVPGGRGQRARDGLDEVEGVGDPEHADAGAQRHPRAVEPPARARERADDHADQQQVGERVGERRRHHHRLARHVVEHGLEDHGGADRGDRERGDRAVGPQRLRHVVGARPHECEHAGHREHREEQEARVRRGGDRRRLHVVEDDRVVEVAERPGEHADADQQPRALLAPRLPGAAQAQQPGEHLDDVMGVVARDRTEREVRERDDLELQDRDPDAEHGKSGHHGAAARRIHTDVSASARLLLE